jgi:hypothetical protein
MGRGTEHSVCVGAGMMFGRLRARRVWSLRGAPLLVAVAGLGMVLWSALANAVDISPFEPLVGRWVGEGRLGVRGNATEQVKCRVTYARLSAGDQLRQSIRCASAGGNVEVVSLVSHQGGRLTGSWQELVRNWSGEMSGSVTQKGFRVAVRGENLSANMDIILINAKQVIEIQFVNSSLIGLTLVLERG